MALRSSMLALITRVSGLIDDASNATFTQQEVQDALDETRITHVYLLLQPVPLFSGGWRYTAFVSPNGGGWESDYTLVDSGYASITAASAELTDEGRWEIAANGGLYTADRVARLSGKQYDIYRAAAELLDTWASTLKLQYDLQTGGSGLGRHRSPLAQKYAQVAATAAAMRRRSRIKSARMVRRDITPGA
jgi:hypothetical protein